MFVKEDVSRADEFGLVWLVASFFLTSSGGCFHWVTLKEGNNEVPGISGYDTINLFDSFSAYIQPSSKACFG